MLMMLFKEFKHLSKLSLIITYSKFDPIEIS